MGSGVLFLLNNPFIWGILTTIGLAYLIPGIGCEGGLIKPEITVKYIAVMLIFLISGMSLKTEDLTKAFSQYHLHLFIQCFSLIFNPLVVQLLLLTLGELYPNPDLQKGFIILSCMPLPVSSAVILTKATGGNEAAAVFNSALGSFLGIFLTPLLLFIFIGSSSSVPFFNAFLQLTFTIVFPVILGQHLRSYFAMIITQKKDLFSLISSGMLLFIIYATFCETFSQQDKLFTFSIVTITIITVLVLQGFLIIAVFFFTTSFYTYFKPEDTVACVFCATHKSLTLGFPLLNVIFANEPTFHLISLPLLAYHPIQILLGSLIVPFLQAWMAKVKKKHFLHSV